MKKLIYILLIAYTASMTITSCTEEEVTPQNELAGKPSDPMRPR